MGRLFHLVPVLLLATITGTVGAEWIGEVREEEGTTYQCKCYSDNACWPSTQDWDRLNETASGALQLALPPGAVCHRAIGNTSISVYDAAKCVETQANWANEQYMTDHPVANLWPFYTNSTCLTTQDPSEPCTRGFYGEYVILATTKEQIKAGVDFARERNLRLIIRNTGHDFMGRSTGFGSLVINTHSFKDVSFVEKYTGAGDWTGGAATVGAGVQGRELFRHAFAQNPKVVIVGGECPTVGWAGGYIQGGGHGPLSGLHGMGADNVLSFDVVTVEGKFVTANAQENPDLFWALKGGGPSTFAVVVAITVKTFPEVPTAGTILNINSTHTNDTKVFNEAFRIFHNLSNHYSSHGMFVYFELSPGRLHIAPFVGPDMDEAKLGEVLEPLFTQLDAAKIPYDRYTKAFSTFFEFYVDMFEDEVANSQAIVGGRLFTQDDIAQHGDGIADALLFAAAPAVDLNGFNVGHIVNPGHAVPAADNAIHAAWRNASSFVITNILMTGTEPWTVKQERQRFNTEVVGQRLRDVSPEGASYVNEGDLYEPHWQEAYWGSKYARLLAIRQQWDPNGVLYTQTTPGTEKWRVVDYGKKLCQAVS